MKKRTFFIGAILSLIPLGKPFLIKTGMVLSTVSMINHSEKVNAKSFWFHFDRAFKKGEIGDYYGAISDFTKAIEINPQYENAYYNRGWNRGKLKDYYGAISDYTKAIEINPQYENAYYNRGNAKEDLKDYYGAISDYTKVIEINPLSKGAYNNISFIKRLKKVNDNYGAIFYATKAIEIDRNYSLPYLNRGVAKENIGDMKGACDDWRKASSLGNKDTLQWVREEC